eukprot:285335-Pleurochrysis_carterae.AAC.1
MSFTQQCFVKHALVRRLAGAALLTGRWSVHSPGDVGGYGSQCLVRRSGRARRTGHPRRIGVRCMRHRHDGRNSERRRSRTCAELRFAMLFYLNATGRGKSVDCAHARAGIWPRWIVWAQGRTPGVACETAAVWATRERSEALQRTRAHSR